MIYEWPAGKTPNKYFQRNIFLFRYEANFKMKTLFLWKIFQHCNKSLTTGA